MRQKSLCCFLFAVIAFCNVAMQPALATCVQFHPGLCPGPADCLCTAFSTCTANETLAQVTTKAGTCAGQCRTAFLSRSCGPNYYCAELGGACVIPTPSPVVPPPPFTPSPIPLNATGMVAIPSMPGHLVDQFEASVEYWSPATAMWELHPFNYPVDALDAANISYRAVSPVSLSPRRVPPQAYISQAQGKKACAAAGKHLCSLAEYLAACSDNYTTFPYGNVYVHGNCNEGNPNPILIVYGPNATWNLTEMNNPILDTLNNTLVPSGTFSKCTNPVTQTFDMSGNLDEWVADVTEEGHGIFKGGYFVDAFINGPGCTYETVAHAPTYHDYSLGFRCCALTTT